MSTLQLLLTAGILPPFTYLKCLIASAFLAYYAQIHSSGLGVRTMNHDINNGKNLATLLAEMKQELQDFAQTRITMLKVEVQEKLRVIKAAAPLAVLGALLLITAFLLFSLALVALVFAFLPDNAYRWFFAFLAIAVLWSIVGGIAGYMAKRELEVKGLLPKRTVEVLKEDKLWIQSEVKQI